MKCRNLWMLALILAGGSLSRSQAQEMQGPYVFKSSVNITTHHYLVYWPSLTAKEPQYNTGTWMPRVDFNVLGPLEGGSQISLAFLKPDGAKWFSANLKTDEIDGENFQHFDFDDTAMEKMATPLAGTFTMQINLSNALTKVNRTLFTGKFDVVKFHYGGTAPNDKNQQDFYVNEDWRLPIGQMNFDTKIDTDAPRLRALMWFKGKIESEQMAAYLYYNGKQIASTKKLGGVYPIRTLEPGTTRPDLRYTRYTFDFNVIAERLIKESANNYDQIFFLNKNPGEYEVKVLRDGKLARSTKFTIGADGKVADNGLASKNKMGYGVILLPITADTSQDGKVDISTYKARAYYGNPVTGFPE